jgi:hypothetical protein
MAGEKTSRQVVQDKLSAKFGADDVLQREAWKGGKKLDYVPIDRVIRRLNEVLPLGYDWSMSDPIVSENAIYIKGCLTITLPDGTTVRREGIGADRMDPTDKTKFDPDKAAKTAMAEALKKATHTLGVALYLWDETERVKLARERIKLEKERKDKNFTKEDVSKMKQIKEQLKLDYAGMDKLVTEWSEGKIVSTQDLTRKDLELFTKWTVENKKVVFSS